MLRSAWRHTDILQSYNWGKGINNIGCNWLLIQANRQTQKALYFLRFSLNSLGTGFAENMIFKIIFPEEFISFENRFKSYFKLSMIIYVLHTCSEIPETYRYTWCSPQGSNLIWFLQSSLILLRINYSLLIADSASQ